MSAKTKLATMHFFVSGKVQGVWFRASTKDQAVALGVTGWVRNLPDGRVEVLASGEQDKLNELHRWLKRGPKHAEVGELIAEEVDWQEYAKFNIV